MVRLPLVAYVVGIDLGTTNTVVATVREGVACTVPGADGTRLIPSTVSFLPSGAVLVGGRAIERRLIDPTSTVFSTKRLIGRAWDTEEVQRARATLPFELGPGPAGGTVVAIGGRAYSLEEIAAFVLTHARANAEAHLRQPVHRAVITVPANFNDLQRAATKTAGRIAGLEVLRILNEPTAAALAYGTPAVSRERIAVFDLGGGTFDVTLLDLAGEVLEVVATAGDTSLGGDDIDILVAERMAEDLLTKHRLDARALPATFGRLRVLAEQMKCALSAGEEHTLVADDIVPAVRGHSVQWRFRMTRPELEWASVALIERTFKVCKLALSAAGAEPREIDRIILVGGATRMPLVARKVRQFFGRSPIVQINPDEVVALGAAIQAALLDPSRSRGGPAVSPRIASDSVVVDAQSAEPSRPPSEAPQGLPIVSLSTARPLPLNSAPLAQLELAKPPVFGERPQKPLVFDPGYDAAPPPRSVPVPPQSQSAVPLVFDAGAPGTPRPAPLLIDVTPLSLGIETVGGFCDILIEANTPVPCDRTRTFATASDSQTSVRVRVTQGESKRSAENTFLGELELSGIPPAPRGKTPIEVTFIIDSDGILDVRARNVTTGSETIAKLQLVGAQTSAADIAAMQSRQAAQPSPLERLNQS
jgi:molecular chaperone DnaK